MITQNRFGNHIILANLNSRMKKYQGPLNLDQICDGINFSIDNANRLLTDAGTLFSIERYPSAAALAILAIEEIGKVSLFRSLTTMNQGEVGRFWKDFRSHRKKNASWILAQLAHQGARKLDDFAAMFDPKSTHTSELDELKQNCFYLDFTGESWSVPGKIISKEKAEALIKIAGLMTKGSPVTRLELELWIKHIGRASNPDFTMQKQALINWYNEMIDRGLKKSGGQTMSEFVTNGLVFPSDENSKVE